MDNNFSENIISSCGSTTAARRSEFNRIAASLTQCNCVRNEENGTSMLKM